MHGYPFEPSASLTLRSETDTALPQPVIPLFLLHTLEHPFCINPCCECHTNQEHSMMLLDEIKRGTLTLHEAANFAQGKTL